jgi:hypothetical protein
MLAGVVGAALFALLARRRHIQTPLSARID